MCAYREMCGSLRHFVDVCYGDSIASGLMTQFTRVDQVYKLFMNQGNTLVSSIQPGHQTRGTFNLLRTSQILLSEWVDFVARFNSVADQGTSPHFHLFVDLFATLVAQLDDVKDMARVGTIRSAAPPEAIEQLQTDATALRREAAAASRIVTPTFDPAAFGERVLALGQSVARVFRTAAPWCTMATGEVMRTRVAVNATCNELVRIGEGMAAFSRLALAVAAHIAQASGALDQLLDYLGVPLGIKLEFPEEDRKSTRDAADRTDGAVGGDDGIDDARCGEL
jgi:hypothetical protein